MARKRYMDLDLPEHFEVQVWHQGDWLGEARCLRSRCDRADDGSYGCDTGGSPAIFRCIEKHSDYFLHVPEDGEGRPQKLRLVPLDPQTGDLFPECIGIDVGGRRKGFHACAMAGDWIVKGPKQLADSDAVLRWLEDREPAVIALDSPRTCAEPGESSRQGERDLASAICGIRWTPEESMLDGNDYYEWIRHGLELYEVLARLEAERGWKIIEVFPTASWTVWAGKRGKQRRAPWTNSALAKLGIGNLPERRMNQDDRDAIAAARTGCQFNRGRYRGFGPIIVPQHD